jgi:hypothetical protein
MDQSSFRLQQGRHKPERTRPEPNQSPTSATLGDDGVYSSTADLAKWNWALQWHALLPEIDMQPGLTLVKLPQGVSTDLKGSHVGRFQMSHKVRRCPWDTLMH